MDPSFISSSPTRLPIFFLSCSLIVCSHLFGNYCYARGENNTAATGNDAHHVGAYYVVALSSLLPEERCACNDTNSMMKGSRESKKTSTYDDELELVHTDDPCSAKHGGQEKAAGRRFPETLANTISMDHHRINSLIHSSSVRRTTQLSSSEAEAATTLPTTYWQPPMDSNLYVVKVSLGTPPQPLSFLFDTGSGIMWTQCQPCFRYSYPQREHIYDPRNSKTYANFTCHSKACRALNTTTVGGAFCFNNTTCSYVYSYGDDSFTVGFWAEETLTLAPSSSAVFKNIRFGCGQRNVLTSNVTVAGILGLSRDSASIQSQTAHRYDQIFSYCFPSKPCFSGYLKFGKSCVTPAVKFTPLKKNPKKHPTFYFIELTGINVAGKDIGVPRSVLTTAETIIDSGTTFTYLPSEAYAHLRTSFREEMKGYRLLPPTNGSTLDTCYDLTKTDTVRLPSVSLIFDGDVKVSIPPSGILLAGSDEAGKKIGCLAFAENNDLGGVTIIGYTQQQTYAVVYDVRGGRLGFGPKGCR